MHQLTENFAAVSRTALICALACAGLAAPAAAFAQAPAEEAQPAPPVQADADAAGNEIVVTATKREQTLQDVPVAVTVTTAETIERAQIRDIRDLSTVVPSLRVNTLQSSASTNFYIRGFGNGANNAGIEPSVGLFVDGVYRSRSAAMISDLPDVQRIEVLRGPQSTLFGKNASAGVISLVTREPKFKLGGNVEASYGNYNAVVAKGYVTGPLAEHVAASLAAGYNRRDGYVRDLGTNTDSNERNRWFVRGQLLIEPTADLKLRLIADYSKIDENCCAVINIQPAAPTQIITAPVLAGGLGGKVNDWRTPFADVTYANFPSTNRIRNWGYSGQLDYSAGLLKLTSITAFRHTGAITNQDSDFTSADLLGRNYQDVQIDTFTQELRASTNWDGPFNALLGAFYYNEKVKQHNELFFGSQFRPYANALIVGQSGGAFNLTQVEQLLSAANGKNYVGQSFLPGSGFTENYRLKDDNYSLFAQFDFKASDRLTLTGGVNFTHDAKTFSTNSQSNEVFSAIPLAASVAGVRNVLIAQGIATSLSIPVSAVPAAAIANFQTTNPVQYAQAAGAAAQLTTLAPLQFMPPFLNVPNAVEPGKVSDGHWSFTARAAYDVSDAINVYASYATGYKAASVNLSRDSRPTAADLVRINAAGLGLPNLTTGGRYAGPEDSVVWEAGLKGNWGVASANLAVFKQTIKGFQSNIFTGTGFYLINAGKQSSVGIEFEGMVKPTRELTLNVALTWLDPNYDEFKVSGVGDLTGTKPGGVSPFTVSLGGQWDHELGNGDHVIARADWHHESPFALVEGLPNLVNIVGTAGAVAAATSRKQEISLINASLTYAMASGIELTVWGRNIGNNRSLLQIFDSPVQLGSISSYPSEPRTWGGAVRYRF
ncbi:TonB-dependent receptor [Novosphingobium bradum]|uniref:TonB-dependent receptor n=1 Tax=Novosphingobium bradum TaxID=1737444 RepID=A0ABV7IMK4_9SPHN